jgi:hypothetical protein
MSNQSRITTAVDKYRRTDAAPALQGGIYETESGQQTFTDGSGNKTWLVDTTGGNVSIALPSAVDVSPDTLFTVKRKTGGANTVTVTPDSGTIDGSAAHSIATQFAAFSYASDGDNYHIVRRYDPSQYLVSADLAPYLTSASAALSTYLTSASASTALATKQQNISLLDEGTSLSTSGAVSAINFVGGGVSASLTGGLATITVAAAGATALGTITTTSGTSNALGSLVLTNYKFLRLVLRDVGFTSAVALVLNTVTITQPAATGGSELHGFVDIDLSTGYACANVLTQIATPTNYVASEVGVAITTVTTATTTLTLTGGTFDSGAVDVLAW